MTIRSFVALPIPRETANQLGDVAAKMSYQDKSGAIRWVDQENYHITLAFLGEQQQTDLEALAEQLDYHLRQTEFRAVLSHLSPFPEARPKIIAAMMDKSDDISCVQRQVMNAIKSTMLLINKRKFIPHVTLGRYRHSRNAYAGGIPMNVSFEALIDEVILFESVLTTSGAEYEPIYRFPLDNYLDQYDEHSNHQSNHQNNF
ncbi:MAG: 2'-5' RNA ligase [Chitinophagales bacterium]|jgi:2'-5' RNA ligase